MKRHLTLAAAAALVLVSSAFALIHAALNRSGDPTAVITLTDRELQYFRNSDESGVMLLLRYQHRNAYPGEPAWLTPQQIAALGFDTSVAPQAPGAYDFYRRQSSRRGFVAFEYDGPAAARLPEEARAQSRLVPIDAAFTAAELQSKYAARKDILILPAILRVTADPEWPATATRPARPARLDVSIYQVPTEIHVPLPFSETLRNLPVTVRDSKSEQPLYHVTLRYGRFHEPQIVNVHIP